ncbi:MAG: adenylyltransferase/cytidyltransferase family protein [Candidatus Wildermuthbacteria bacterium]|nr:adenylyltransferase/cytidyltransferase family protein [Candidatus Wildermuthbacteria bacterium]
MKALKNRIILDYPELKKIIEAHKIIGHRIVCTIGSWDMLHIGHLRYLIKAKDFGDILVVGADSDRGIKIYKKSELRPIIPQDERMEMLQYQECVDYVTLVDDIDEQGNWQYGLAATLQPHVFVTTPDSYSKEQLDGIRRHVGEVIVLPRQAENTSTSIIIEQTTKKHIEKLLSEITKRK